MLRRRPQPGDLVMLVKPTQKPKFRIGLVISVSTHVGELTWSLNVLVSESGETLQTSVQDIYYESLKVIKVRDDFPDQTHLSVAFNTTRHLR